MPELLAAIMVVLLFIGIMFLILIATAKADITNSTCQSNTISRVNQTYQLTVNNGITTNVTNITLSGDIICPNSCNYATGFCFQAVSNLSSFDIAIVIALMLLPFFFTYMSFNLKSTWLPLQVFFLFISLFFVVADLAVINIDLVNVNNAPVSGIVTGIYQVTLYGTIFTAVIYLGYFVYEVFTKWGDFFKKKAM